AALGGRAAHQQARSAGVCGHDPPARRPGRARERRPSPERRERPRRRLGRRPPRRRVRGRPDPDGLTRGRGPRGRPRTDRPRHARRQPGPGARGGRAGRSRPRRPGHRLLPRGGDRLGRVGLSRARRPAGPARPGPPALRRRLPEVVHRRPRARSGCGGSAARQPGRHRGRGAGRRARGPDTRRGGDGAGGAGGAGDRPGPGRGRVAMWPALQTFRARDAVDILVVAFVLYRIFVMFKETRAVQMLLGLAGLMVASFLARHFELFSTSWLLDNFWSVWVLALVVLFQPELRRALTRLGESRLFQGMALGAREERIQLIDEVIKAADALASKRIGALIVLERSTGLRNY